MHGTLRRPHRHGAGRASPAAAGLGAVPVYCYANGLLSSRRIERATYRDIGARFIAANTHPDHDTIATFRRTSKAAFLDVLLARETGILKARHGVNGRDQDRRQRFENP